MFKKISIRWKIIIVLLLMGLLTGFLLLRNKNQLPTLSKEEHLALYNSEDNGFLLFLEARKLLTHDSTEMQDALTLMYEEEIVSNQLRSYIESNAPALEKLREGLAKPYVIAPYMDNQNLNNTLLLTKSREMGRHLVYQAHLDAMDGNIEEASNGYLELIHYGQSNGQGAVLISGLVSIAIQHLATDPGEPFLKLLPDISNDQLDNLIQQLEADEKSSSPLSKC